MHCYADVRANGYFLGNGPPRLTVLVYFLHYWENYFATPDRTHDELVDLGLWATERVLEEGDAGLSDDPSAGIYGREILLFLGPSHNHATEVWQVFGTWDVQRQEDGTVIAVHPARDHWARARPDEYQTHRAALEMELPAFTQAVADAQTARIAENNGRIAPADISSKAEGVDLPMLITDANRLSQFYTDAGAYNHPGRTADPTVAGASLRPGQCGSLSSLTYLFLNDNRLEGTIPGALGGLRRLYRLNLNGHQLTGEIPGGVGEPVPTDLPLPRRQPAGRSDTGGTGQPGQPDGAVSLWQPAEWRDTGQFGRLGRTEATGNQ